MKKLLVLFKSIPAGYLIEDNKQYIFEYLEDYKGPSISLTLPLQKNPYTFNTFPPFFDGLLPEGVQLEGLLKTKKLDRHDYMNQLLSVGRDLIGAVTIIEEE